MNMQELKNLIYDGGEKVDIECKEAARGIPKSIYETYSAFANTKGGYIILGVKEDKTKNDPRERYIIQGVEAPREMISEFWNTINSQKVNANILRDEDVYVVEEDGINLVVIYVPRVNFNSRPVYIGADLFKGTYKRNHEGDYHASGYEIRGMLRDRNPEGNDGVIIENYTLDDIDKETIRKYRQIFENKNKDHVWNSLGDKEFLEKLGGYGKDRGTGVEGLTLAGLMMFGTGQAIREKYANIFMDYRNECEVTEDVRWNDRITIDGTWENNLFNFFTKVTPKLTEDLRKPFKLEGIQRVDETPVHKAIREAFVNLIIHADYLTDDGTLGVIKKSDGFEFTNPGILKLSIDDIYRGGNSKSRNPHMQTMFRLVGFGDNAGSGFPAILSTWEKEDWVKPELIENTELNQVTLKLKMIPKWTGSLQNMGNQINMAFKNALGWQYNIFENLAIQGIDGMETGLTALADAMPSISMDQFERLSRSLKCLSDKVPHSADGYEKFIKIFSDKVRRAIKSAEKSAESEKSAKKSAEKSAESKMSSLTKRQVQVLECMEVGVEYSTKEIMDKIGLKGPRTRQLLNELVSKGFVTCTAATKNRRYTKN